MADMTTVPIDSVNQRQLEKTLRHLPALISNILTESLDPGILEIATGKVGDAHTGVIYVDQSTTIGSGVLGALRSPTTSLSVVIVDRTADLEQAAQSILKARVSFSGKSPYSPDLILINEFVKKEFLRLLLQHSAEYLTADETHVNGAKRGKDIERPDHSERSKGIRTIMSGSTGSIVDVEER